MCDPYYQRKPIKRLIFLFIFLINVLLNLLLSLSRHWKFVVHHTSVEINKLIKREYVFYGKYVNNIGKI